MIKTAIENNHKLALLLRTLKCTEEYDEAFLSITITNRVASCYTIVIDGGVKIVKYEANRNLYNIPYFLILNAAIGSDNNIRIWKNQMPNGTYEFIVELIINNNYMLLYTHEYNRELDGGTALRRIYIPLELMKNFDENAPEETEFALSLINSNSNPNTKNNLRELYNLIKAMELL